MKRISIGIDTSCYTTSIVAVDENHKIVYEGRKMLEVKEGTVGLRQSDAFFQHVMNLPDLYQACMKVLDAQSVGAVVVSTRPRNVEGSYMPVFMAGSQFARVIADTLSVPLYQVSHQENHLYASAFNHELPEKFIGVHMSGGTTEFLKVAYKDNFTIELLGGTLDLSFGKLIDRLGVYMGYQFPCGKALDHSARESKEYYPLKTAVKGLDFNISGIENRLKQLYEKDGDRAKVARSLFEYISKLLLEILEKTKIETGIGEVVISGGVAANTIIRQRLKSFSGTVIFTDIEFATDHAVGNAYYGVRVMTY